MVTPRVASLEANLDRARTGLPETLHAPTQTKDNNNNRVKTRTRARPKESKLTVKVQMPAKALTALAPTTTTSPKWTASQAYHASIDEQVVVV